MHLAGGQNAPAQSWLGAGGSEGKAAPLKPSLMQGRWTSIGSRGGRELLHDRKQGLREI